MTVSAHNGVPDLSLQEQAIARLTRFRLANGLRVWSQPRPGTATIALAIQIPVGSRHETEANNGISHFLEHMLFTGTERWSENEVMDVVRQRGGVANALTGVDDTMIYLHVDARHLSLAVEWLYQVVFCPTLSQEKFDKERKVIVNEKGGEFGRLRRLYDWVEARQLGWDVGKAVQRHLFPASSLLLPVIGTDASLKSIDRNALAAYYRQHYVPNNLTLIAVGDFEPEAFRALVENTFGAVTRGAPPPPPPPVRFDRTPFALRLRGPAPNEQGQFLLGAPLGPDNHPDRYAWWVLAEMLERAYTQEIRFRRGLTYDVNVYTTLFAEGGYFAVYTQTEVAYFPQVREIVEHGLARLLEGNFAAEELEDARTMIRGRTLLNLQNNLDLVWWHSTDALIVGDDDPIPDYFAGIRAVDADTVRRVAQTYLRLEQRFIVVHNPAVTPRRARPWVAAGMTVLSAALLGWRLRSQRRV